MTLDKPTFDQLVTTLLPEMSDPQGRRALVESALFGSPVLVLLQWEGAARPFTVRLIRQLDDFGEYEAGRPALVALLQELHEQVGHNRQAEITQLIRRLTPQGASTMSIEAAGFMFLIEVGRWATTELQERWRLRRREQSIQLDQLDGEADLREQIEPVMTEIIAEKGEKEVRHRLELIEEKRELIRSWERSKVSDQRSAQLGRMTDDVVAARARDFNQQIERTLRDIEHDLEKLGFTVDKENLS